MATNTVRAAVNVDHGATVVVATITQPRSAIATPAATAIVKVGANRTETRDNRNTPRIPSNADRLSISPTYVRRASKLAEMTRIEASTACNSVAVHGGASAVFGDNQPRRG